MLATGNAKINWNGWHFDDPRIRAKGVRIEGKIHDAMWMFKHYQPRLPRGLQSVSSLFNFPFPWKHLYSVDLPWYGCADVDSLQSIVHKLPQLMKQRGVWNGYIRHVMELNPIFSRASQNGIPVSIEKHEETKQQFLVERKKVDVELQDTIPDEIRNIRPKRKTETGFDYGYIREPKIVGECRTIYAELGTKLAAEGKRVIPFEEYVNRKHHKELERKRAVAIEEERDTKYGECDLVYATFKDEHGEEISRWCLIEEFKASSTQIQRYLKWKQAEIRAQAERLKYERQEKYGGRNPELTKKINELIDLADDYEIPINLKTKKATTGKQDLEEMFFNTGDRVLELTRKVRSLDTNLNNFLPNWLPGKDGKVHPMYGYTAPSGQINSWSPNSQNVSKHTEYGKMMRGVIQAPPGYCFVEADKKSFHVGTLGYCANDRSYIRFSQIDPHSILGSYIDPSIIGCSISLRWDDEQIATACKEFKKRCKEIEEKDPLHGVNVRQALAKPTVLGNQLEVGAKKLQRQNQRFIKTVAEAIRLQAIIGDLFPKPTQYKAYIKELAYKQRYLINEFGRIDYFWDVFQFARDKKTNKWVKKEGERARDPIAFRVQSTAFGMITDELLELEQMGVCEEHNFIVTIHDSLVFMPEIGKKDKCVELVHRVMNKPCPKLVNDATGQEGLKIGVEIAVGDNWKEMKEIKI
jgi:DNA polymerase I-like protein with 3'-5' exonuclease and polymerase domains